MITRYYDYYRCFASIAHICVTTSPLCAKMTSNIFFLHLLSYTYRIYRMQIVKMCHIYNGEILLRPHLHKPHTSWWPAFLFLSSLCCSSLNRSVIWINENKRKGTEILNWMQNVKWELIFHLDGMLSDVVGNCDYLSKAHICTMTLASPTIRFNWCWNIAIRLTLNEKKKKILSTHFSLCSFRIFIAPFPTSCSFFFTAACISFQCLVSAYT